MTAKTDEDVRFTGTPVLCAEILSSNRANDYIVKTTAEWVAFGVGDSP